MMRQAPDLQAFDAALSLLLQATYGASLHGRCDVLVQGSLLNEWRGPLGAIASLMSLLPAVPFNRS